MKENDNSDDESISSDSVSSENIEYNQSKKKQSVLKIENNDKNEIIVNDSDKYNNSNEDSDDLNNIHINEIKQSNSYNSVFSFANVSRKDFNNMDLDKSDDNNNIIEEKEKEPNDNNDISIWETIKQQISNVKNQIVFNFNIFSGNNNLNLKDKKLPQVIQIFDEKFDKQDEKLLNVLQSIPWFSYRKNFNQIKDKDTIYTSDAGWGCMIRASQMFLAQGIYKLFSFKNLNDFLNEFITFFYDNKIPLKLLVKKNTNDVNKNKKKETISINNKEKNKENKEETFEDFLIVDITRECRISFLDVTKDMVKDLEKLSKQENNTSYMTPPFSLRNIIKTQNMINPNGKKVGEWFSNYDMMKIFTKINKQMIEKQDCDFKIINFENETIYIEELIKECFEEVETQGFEYISKSNFDKIDNTNNTNSIILNENDVNINTNHDFYIFNQRRYKFKQKFIVFVSVRHGLQSLNEDIYEDVLKIFDIKTNIGLIGGKSSRAFYFIGKCGNNLIFLDPHYVQQTISLNELGTNNISESYRPNDIYYMDISELSPSFSAGFAIKDMKSFKLFMEKMTKDDYFVDQKIGNSLGKKNNYLFKVKNYYHPFRDNDDSNQDISNNIDVRENFY